MAAPFNQIALSEEVVHALAEFATLWLRYHLNVQREPEAVEEAHRDAIHMIDEMVNRYGGDGLIADMLPREEPV